MSFAAVIVHTDIPFAGEADNGELENIMQVIASGTPIDWIRTDDEECVRMWASKLSGAQRCRQRSLAERQG